MAATADYSSYLDRKYGAFSEIRYSNLSTDPGSMLFAHPERFQIDIDVRTFPDYLKLLERNYVMSKNHKSDLTAFRPSSMTREQAEAIAKKVSGGGLAVK